MKNTILILISLILWFGCSTTKKKSVAESKSVHVKEAEITLEDVSKKLNEISIAAQEAGEETVQYLISDFYLKASISAMYEDHTTAYVLYENIYHLRPNDEYIKTKYAVSMIRVGKVLESLPLLEDIYKSSHYKDGKIGLLLAGVYTALSQKDNARKTYRTVLANEPKNQDACVFLAKSLALDKSYNEAENLLSACEKRVKNEGIFSYYKGKISLEQGKRAQALRQFSDALKADPNFYQAVLAQGILYEEKEQYKEAITIYEKYLTRDSNNNLILARLVQLLFLTEKYVEVLPYAETLSQLDPSNLNLQVKLGILYSEIKKYDKAKATFKQILAEVPNSDKILYYLGALHQETNDLEDSLKYYNQIGKDSPLFLETNLQIAKILGALASQDSAGKRDSEFLGFVSEMKEKFPDNKLDFVVIKANFYENKEDYKNAIKVLNEFQEQKNFLEEHYYYLASLYEKTKMFDESFNLINKLLVKNPDNPNALNFLGFSLLEQDKDLPQAYNYISKAIKLKPDDGYIRDSLGWYYFKIGQYEQSLKELRAAREKIENDVVISKHLAVVLQALKKYNEAKKFYVEALKNSKVQADRNDVLKAMEELEVLRSPASTGVVKDSADNSFPTNNK
ncbi:MAG: tetratricopeptide repeat protein [Bacteriovoracaceae bacterium]